MKKLVSLLVCVMFLGCGSGKTGPAGAMGPKGPAGEAGPAGSSGKNGKDGVDGNDNHFVKNIFCTGIVTSGVWSGIIVTWDAMVTSSGDVLVSGTLENLGNFNVSSTSFYSASQVGASTGAVAMYIDDYNFSVLEYNPNTDGIKITITGSSPSIIVDNDPDVCKNYFF